MANVKFQVFRITGEIEDYPYGPNVNTNSGLNLACRQLYDPTYSGSAQSLNFIAVSSGSGYTPGATDTTLSGEVTLTGLGRASGSFTTGSVNNVWQVAKTFTWTGASAITLTGSALFDAVTAGVMAHSSLFTANATLNTNDQIAVTWSGSLT